MMRPTRPISWIKGARKAFEDFPEEAQSIGLAALTIAVEGGKTDVAKPMKELGAGVFEIALRYVGNAFRVIYAIQLGDEVWVVMPFRRSRRRASGRLSTRSI